MPGDSQPGRGAVSALAGRGFRWTWGAHHSSADVVASWRGDVSHAAPEVGDVGLVAEDQGLDGRWKRVWPEASPTLRPKS